MTTHATKTTTWAIDPTHAEFGFAVRHLMLSTVRGRFGVVTGTITVDENDFRVYRRNKREIIPTLGPPHA